MTPASGPDDLTAEHDLAVALARAAAALQMRERHGLRDRAGDRVTTKAHANDLVSDVDVASEKLIVDGLLAAFPDDGVLGEEGGGVPGRSGRRWVVDPLDGTRNYLSGSGPWSVSIALQVGSGTTTDSDDSGLVVGVVHDPLVDETFSAVSDTGARLDGDPVGASRAERLSDSLAGLSFQPSTVVKQRLGPVVADLLPVVGDVRRLPAALHLAYLAAGRLDCGLLVGPKLYDVAAGLVLARAAGVVVDGTPPELVLAANPRLWPEFSACAAVRRLSATGA